MKLRGRILFVALGVVATVMVLATAGLAHPTAGEKTTAYPERHPRLEAAIADLQAARDYMYGAAHDFCGHKENAIRDSDEALRQLRRALESDRVRVDRIGDEVAFENASFTVPAAARERHPMIKKAINSLQNARHELQNAAHDYHGHRVEALEATNRAIEQLRFALACDRY